jgi:hypothetical protein
MRYHHSIFGALWIVVAASTPLGAQAPSGGIRGFYDPATGLFRPARLPDSAEPRALVSRAGRIRFKIKTKVRSDVPPDALPVCFLSFSHQGVARRYEESFSVVGTRDGNTALCDHAIAFNWSTADSDRPVELFYQMGLTGSTQNIFEFLPSIPLPADGATTLVVVDTAG